jgi:hypothetical protein
MRITGSVGTTSLQYASLGATTHVILARSAATLGLFGYIKHLLN